MERRDHLDCPRHEGLATAQEGNRSRLNVIIWLLGLLMAGVVTTFYKTVDVYIALDKNTTSLDKIVAVNSQRIMFLETRQLRLDSRLDVIEDHVVPPGKRNEKMQELR